MRIERLLGWACGAMLLSVAALAADWPEWRGPRRDAVSTETGLLKEWPKEGPRLVWQAKDIGDGYATPSVAGNRIYVLSNRGMDNEFVQALSTLDGKQVWATRLGRVGNPDQMPSFPAARSTPTVDGGLLYALGSDGDLACVETASGAIRWRKSLRADFGGAPGKSGYTESPLVDGEAVVVTPGGAQATMVALNNPAGRLVVGTMAIQATPGAGALYSIDKNLQVKKLLDNLCISNGMGWSLDYSIFYFIDSPTRKVMAFDYNLETGDIRNKRVIITVPKVMGVPDGMTVDEKGMLWIALWGGSCVSRWNPLTGKLLQIFPIPALNASSCTFGGLEMDELYITTARQGMNKAQLNKFPLSGSIFRFKTDIKGMKNFIFTG